MRLLLVFMLLACGAKAQWQILDAHTTADLRGVDAIGSDIAWASGTHGTVLRTNDGGKLWHLCTVPPGADKLDFRAVQAFDAQTAIVMSSGKGALSVLYRTSDGCQSWKKVFDNPEETGFFDSLRRVTSKQLYLLGDPVGGKFALYFSRDAGLTWYISDDPGLDAPAGRAAFAASNSALASAGSLIFFGTGGTSAAVYTLRATCPPAGGDCITAWKPSPVPLAQGADSQGVFSTAARFLTSANGKTSAVIVAVGGDYTKPDATAGIAASSHDAGLTWTPAVTLPGGYRSAAVYSSATMSWITVGPNGTDISSDDGRNWHPLKPGPTDTPDADKNWNALSLPFVVGPHGRIGVLRKEAVQTH